MFVCENKWDCNEKIIKTFISDTKTGEVPFKVSNTVFAKKYLTLFKSE